MRFKGIFIIITISYNRLEGLRKRKKRGRGDKVIGVDRYICKKSKIAKEETL